MRYLAARDKGLPVFKEKGYEIVDGDKWQDHPELVLFSGGLNSIAVKETIAEFEKREGVTVKTNYNGCGILVSEIKTGQHPDAYFACDTSYLEDVRGIFNDPQNVSSADMVIIVKKGNPKNIKSLNDLTKPGIKIAVTNPKFSALGGLTVRLFEKNGISKAVESNISYRDSPTADFVVTRVGTGPEDAGIVYRPNSIRSQNCETIEINADFATAYQPIAVLKDSENKYLMQRLIDRIKSAESKERFINSGFDWEVKE